jgi:hypothetical protein
MKPFHKIIVLQQVMAYFLAAGGCDLVWLFANGMRALFVIIALPIARQPLERIITSRFQPKFRKPTHLHSFHILEGPGVEFRTGDA